MNEPPLDPPSPQRQFKGVWLCAALLDDEALSPAEKILLAEIDSLTHPEKACYASNEFLAKRLHLSAAHMRDTLAELTSNGYLIRISFTGRVTLRCVHPTLSGNPQCINGLLEVYGIKLPPGDPSWKPGKQKASDTRYRKNPTPKNSPRENPLPEPSYRKNPIAAVADSRPQTSEISDTEIFSKESSSERETTTTPHARAHTKDAPQATEDQPGVVVASSLKASSYEQDAEMDEETLEDLATEFGLNAQQSDDLRVHVKRNGISYVEEKAEITRAEPRNNAAKFFMKALEGDWKPPVKIARKPRHVPQESSKEEAPAGPAPDFSVESKLWKEASPEQRNLWLSHPLLDQFRGRGIMQEPGNWFLGNLRAILKQQQEAAA